MSATDSKNHLVWMKGRGRGFRPSHPFSPSRRPVGKIESGTDGATTHTHDASDENLKNNTTQETKQIPPTEISIDHQYIVKYHYKANAESPLGEAELDLVQGEHVTIVERHKDNDMWVKVKRENGNCGFVPAKYLHKVEERITTLPWLANKQLEEEKEIPTTGVKAPLKAYVSAYAKEEQQSEKLKKYYCAVCEKQLNGPKPYSAHMVSKAHKLEVELAEERD